MTDEFTPTPFQLFEIGEDTASIADLLGIEEHEAYNRYARERDYQHRIRAAEIDRQKRRERARRRRLEERNALRVLGRNEHGKILYAGAG